MQRKSFPTSNTATTTARLKDTGTRRLIQYENSKSSKANRINKNSTAKATRKKNIRRRDGLLNTTIPMKSEEMRVAKRNMEKSPLFRLPEEIRAIIFEYVIGGHLIEMSYRYWDKSFEYKIQRGGWYESSGPFSAAPHGRALTSAFSLLQVCRKVYTETALLPYKLNTFKFEAQMPDDLRLYKGDYHNPGFTAWTSLRGTAQRNAVTSIEPTRRWLCSYICGHRATLRSKFPNLKHVSLRHRQETLRKSLFDLQRSKRMRDEMAAVLREREGEDLIIDVHERHGRSRMPSAKMGHIQYWSTPYLILWGLHKDLVVSVLAKNMLMKRHDPGHGRHSRHRVVQA